MNQLDSIHIKNDETKSKRDILLIAFIWGSTIFIPFLTGTLMFKLLTHHMEERMALPLVVMSIVIILPVYVASIEVAKPMLSNNVSTVGNKQDHRRNSLLAFLICGSTIFIPVAAGLLTTHYLSYQMDTRLAEPYGLIVFALTMPITYMYAILISQNVMGYSDSPNLR